MSLSGSLVGQGTMPGRQARKLYGNLGRHTENHTAIAPSSKALAQRCIYSPTGEKIAVSKQSYLQRNN